ncbi:mannosyl-oligosaccharide glucosidase GCS1-like [Camellia sinensis]|uniref:mannosyl-oligosaccharide glucosidase GCS1-like n=1 Tax=Camellia sinensis TaxID=4442 RepID=UPI001036F21E|nr:mannosyl-oligosaccharide glucosidase GCS1-like [Camellia sinensis]
MQTVHLFFYLADEDGNALSLSRETLNIRENSLLAVGSRTDVGSWNLNLESMDDLEVHYSGFKISHIHNLSDLVQQNLGAQVRKFGRLQLSDTTNDSSNILVFQILGRISFRIDVAFISGTGVKDSRLKERLSSLTSTLLTSQLDEKENEFDDKFKKCFNLADELDSESISTGKAAVASLLGGIGYFYGQSKISVPSNSNRSNNEKDGDFIPKVRGV